MSGEAAASLTPVSFREALRFWLKLGFISFGGPAGQIAIMHQELVDRRRWISEGHFLHALNFCMLLPGPEAQQLATYLGWLMHGVRGGIAAGALFVLPSLVLLIGLSWCYLAYGHSPWIAGALSGVKPAVVAIVLVAAWRIGSRSLRSRALFALAIAGCAARLAGVSFPLLIGTAALAGWLYPGLASSMATAHGAAQDVLVPSRRLVGVDAWRRLLVVALSGLVLWSVVLGGLVLGFGATHPYAQMGWFFTKAALLTFGGAYAVLPYVYDGAVTHFGWLTAPQMLDGLALGETTPGPLIMIVAFVGFLGGWQLAGLGPEALAAAGMVGALVATWFTFLPSFLFILGGAPLVEASRGVTALVAPLAAISAVVVGVIVHLALFLAGHVLWVDGRLEPVAVAIACAAAWALAVRKRQVVEVVIAAAAIGVAASVLPI